MSADFLISVLSVNGFLIFLCNQKLIYLRINYFIPEFLEDSSIFESGQNYCGKYGS